MTIDDFISSINNFQDFRVKTTDKNVIVEFHTEHEWVPMFKIAMDKSYKVRYCLPHKYRSYYQPTDKVCFIILKFVCTPFEKRDFYGATLKGIDNVKKIIFRGNVQRDLQFIEDKIACLSGDVHALLEDSSNMSLDIHDIKGKLNHHWWNRRKC